MIFSFKNYYRILRSRYGRIQAFRIAAALAISIRAQESVENLSRLSMRGKAR